MTAERAIPDGWRWVRFGDVVRQVKQTTKDPEGDGLTRIVGLGHVDSESLMLRRWDELDELPDGTSFTRVFRAGHVLFGKRRAYQRKVAVAGFDGVCSGDLLVFEPSTGELLAEFLPYVVQSDAFFDQALGTSAGSLSPRTKWKDLANHCFPLPPEQEQRAIVLTMTAFQEARTAVERAAQLAADTREAVLQELLDSDVPRTPLGELARVASGESFKADQTSSQPFEGARPIVGIKNLGDDGTISFDEVTYVEGIDREGLVTLDERSLVVIRTNGNEERIGNVYRPPARAFGFALSAFTFACCFDDETQRDLAFEYMQSRGFQSWATSLVAGSTGLKNLPIRTLRTALVPVMSGSAAQALATLQSLRSVESALLQHAEQMGQLARAVREHLLEGDHDVR